jgi:predicted DNA repair protein MutK
MHVTLNLLYNLFTHPTFLFEKMGGVFLGKFVIVIPSLIVVLKFLPHLLSPCEKVGGAFIFSLCF